MATLFFIFLSRYFFFLHPYIYKYFYLVTFKMPLGKSRPRFYYVISDHQARHITSCLLAAFGSVGFSTTTGQPLADNSIWKARDHVTGNVIPITSCPEGKKREVPIHPYLPAWLPRFSVGFMWSPVLVD